MKNRQGDSWLRSTGLILAGTIENAQAMAAHESPRTTKLYAGRVT
jgi:hypothetical protein